MGGPAASTIERLWLADWRRRVAQLYGEVRAVATSDPPAAWDLWRVERESLFRAHPQSPVPVGERLEFRARHWPYDDRLRFTLAAAAPPPSEPRGPGLTLPNSGSDELWFRRAGSLAIPLASGPRTLALYWMAGYGGGLFLPFRDPTNGHETYGAGRYLLDTAKGADLGGDPGTATLIVDINFAYHPSCAYDPAWACPLAPPENRLDVRIEAGERLR
jgi:uncharacterized protein